MMNAAFMLRRRSHFRPDPFAEEKKDLVPSFSGKGLQGEGREAPGLRGRFRGEKGRGDVFSVSGEVEAC